MTAPEAPNFFMATAAIARLTFLRIVRGRKLWVAGVAALVVVAFPAIIALSQDEPDREALHEAVKGAVEGGVDWGVFRLLVFLLPILFTSGTIGEEVEGRTLHFLAMRPLPRASIALGKYAVGLVAGLAVKRLGYSPEAWADLHDIAPYKMEPRYQPRFVSVLDGKAAIRELHATSANRPS